MLDNARQLDDDIKRQSAVLEDIRTAIGEVIVGQEYMIERLLVGLLDTSYLEAMGRQIPRRVKKLSRAQIPAKIGERQQRF